MYSLVSVEESVLLLMLNLSGIEGNSSAVLIDDLMCVDGCICYSLHNMLLNLLCNGNSSLTVDDGLNLCKKDKHIFLKIFSLHFETRMEGNIPFTT